MITKLLRKFCSAEVKLMLTHLEEHPEDFDILSDSRWANLLDEISRRGTFAEQVVTRNIRSKVFEKRRRDEYLQAIVKQTIDPESKYEGSVSSTLHIGPHQVQTAQTHLQQMQQLQQARLSQIYQAQQALNTQQVLP
jgi:hypothetical protein